ncbi:unnamed protein product [Rhizoctonia solani]|uniref:NACHT domain-containing protein n=1 Tax=Rhizoctonia solani TaxID=456999 RepID=A0A8H3D9S5_9AGAM|nr:unnamed protein product [Rhizoctonia solani]
MKLKGLLKPGKPKKPKNESPGSPSRVDTPSSLTRGRGASLGPISSVTLSALVLNPLASLPALSPLEQRPTEPVSTSRDAWDSLATFLAQLNQSPLLAPIATVIDNLNWFVRAHENIITTRTEYEIIRTQLEGLFRDLSAHLSGDTPPAMTVSMLNLCEAIQAELGQLYGTQDRDTISSYLQADQDVENILGCYRRIHGHLERLMLNVNMSIWKIIDKQTIETCLARINPSMSASYNSAEASLVRRSQCTPNTRKQVLLELEAWKNNQDGEKVCWMNGMAGTGKTTIANTLCSLLASHHELGASFFCSRSLPSCRDVRLIFPTIAYQLARFSSPFRNALSQALERDPDIHTKVIQVQFEHMILEPWQSVMSSLPTNIVVVIDALDECEDANGVEQVLEVLLEHSSKLPIKFLVSSRPEHHIRQKLGQFVTKAQLVLHELEEKIVKADIETYLRQELASISITDDQLATLIERTGVLFIYAATVVRYIKAGDSSERLDTVLKASGLGRKSSNKTKEIDNLYNTVLTSAFDNPDLEDSEQQRMELVLHTVICAQEPLTVDGLAGLLNLDLTKVMAALKPLWSVLHVSELDTNNRVSAIHASFPEYMLDPGRSGQFACSAEAQNLKLAGLCFGRIKRDTPQFNICNLESSFVFDEDVPEIHARVKQAIPLDLIYACRYWAIHLSLSGKSNIGVKGLHEFLSQRLLLWMEVLNLTQTIDNSIGIIETAVSWAEVNRCSEVVKLLAQDARRFVAMFATSPVARSTPHIYVSMLASWPNDHPVAQCYAPQATDLVRIEGIQTIERQLDLLSMISAGSSVECISFSPDGAFFAVGTNANTILVWDALTCRATIGPLKRHTAPVSTIVISPDSTHICSGSQDRTLCIWDSQNGHLIAGPLEGHTDMVRSVDYSPDGLWIASGARDNTVRIWSSQNGYEGGKVMKGQDGRIYSVTFSPDGSLLATGSNSLIHLWDPHHGRLIGDPLKGHTDYITAVEFTPDGRYLVSGSNDSTMRVWDVDSRQTVFGPFQEQPLGINDIAVSPDGTCIASGDLDGPIRLWDIRSGSARSFLGHTGIMSVAFSPDGTRLISGSWDTSVRIWELQGRSPVRQVVESRSEGHKDWVRSVSFSPCGTYLISGSDDMTVRIWNSQSGRLIGNPLRGHKGRVLSVETSADSSHILSVSDDRAMHVWDLKGGNLGTTFGPIETDSHIDEIYQELWPTVFSWDDRKLACGSYSGRIYMYQDNRQLFVSSGSESSVYSLAFAPGSLYFVSGHRDGGILVWDANSGERLLGPLLGHSKLVSSLAFSPDGSLIASGSYDKTLRLWNAQTGIPVGDSLLGHTGGVTCIAFSPNGAYIVSGSHDKSVHVRDAATGRSTAVFNGHTDQVLSVSISPDGNQIASGSADMTMRLWRAPGSADFMSSGILEISQRASIHEDTHVLDWEMDGDGWVKDKQQRLLLWVPPDLRTPLLRPQNLVLISHQGCIELDFSDARIGDMWATCFRLFPEASEV